LSSIIIFKSLQKQFFLSKYVMGKCEKGNISTICG